MFQFVNEKCFFFFGGVLACTAEAFAPAGGTGCAVRGSADASLKT